MALTTTDDAPVGMRPFPLAPHFNYGGHLALEPGDHVWWSDDEGFHSGTVLEIHIGDVCRPGEGEPRKLRGLPEDKCLVIESDQTGTQELIHESRCHRDRRAAA